MGKSRKKGPNLNRGDDILRNGAHNLSSKSLLDVEYDNESYSEDDESTTINISVSQLRNIIHCEISKVIDQLKSEINTSNNFLQASLFDCFTKMTEPLQTQLTEVVTQVSSVVREVNVLSKKCKDSKVEPIAQKNDVVPAATVATTISLEDALLEIKKRELKRDNVVIFNIQESNDKSNQTRVDHDKTVYKSICQKIAVPEHEIKSIYRIGRFDPNKCRPVVVKTSAVIKSTLLANARLLKTQNEKWVIKPDLTKKEQQNEKAVFEEFKRRRNAGEKVFIRNNKIICRNDETAAP